MARKKKNEENENVPNVPAAADSERLKSQEDDLNAVNTVDISQDELNKELKRFLIPKLRSASYRWKFRSDAIKAARKSRGIYECAMCGCEMKNGEFKADHIDPVVPIEGWDGLDWTLYIKRMFVPASGFQIICTSCHDIKTDTEITLRKMYREKKKQAKKT